MTYTTKAECPLCYSGLVEVTKIEQKIRINCTRYGLCDYEELIP